MKQNLIFNWIHITFRAIGNILYDNQYYKDIFFLFFLELHI
jgi:hypothetical protein